MPIEEYSRLISTLTYFNVAPIISQFPDRKIGVYCNDDSNSLTSSGAPVYSTVCY